MSGIKIVMAYHLLTILCRTTEEAAFAAAKLGHFTEIDRLFVFLKTEPAPESIMWMSPQDRSITLERAIEHQDAEGIGVRAAVLYSSPHYWTLMFCWAHDAPERTDVLNAVSALNQEMPVQGKLWGNLRENIVIDGFEAVCRRQAAHDRSSVQGQTDASVFNDEIELIAGMRGLPVSRKALIQVIAESAPLRGVGIHPSVQQNTPFWSDIQSLIALSASVNQENPSTFILSHSGSASQTVEMLRALPRHCTSIVFASKSEGDELASSAEIKPYRIVYGKDDIMALLFKIA